KKVVDPLKDGLWSLNRVYEALIDGDVDSFSGEFRNYSFIREQIVETEQSLQKSEQAANSGLKSLDENIEILTQDEGKLEREKRSTQQDLDNLKTEQESNNKLLKQSEESVEVARSHLRSARDTLQRQEERKRNAEIVTGVGAGLLVIPVVGWIASAMVIGGAVDLAEASKAVRDAEEEERRSESEVNQYRSRVSEYNSKISQTKSKISQKNEEIEQIRKKIQKVKEQRAAVAEFQSTVRKAVRILSILSGRVSAVECQTRRFIHLEPVTKVMEDVMKAAGDIGGNQLLSDEDVPRLLNTMRENNRKLAAICNSSNNPEDEGYY
uniref:Si:dkey-85k15.6 n=1 Tax=Astyanax mexicanus TaxID=7994 RepID=W5KGC4_ASTMX